MSLAELAKEIIDDVLHDRLELSSDTEDAIDEMASAPLAVACVAPAGAVGDVPVATSLTKTSPAQVAKQATITTNTNGG